MKNKFLAALMFSTAFTAVTSYAASTVLDDSNDNNRTRGTAGASTPLRQNPIVEVKYASLIKDLGETEQTMHALQNLNITNLIETGNIDENISSALSYMDRLGGQGKAQFVESLVAIADITIPAKHHASMLKQFRNTAASLTTQTGLQLVIGTGQYAPTTDAARDAVSSFITRLQTYGLKITQASFTAIKKELAEIERAHSATDAGASQGDGNSINRVSNKKSAATTQPKGGAKSDAAKSTANNTPSTEDQGTPGQVNTITSPANNTHTNQQRNVPKKVDVSEISGEEDTMASSQSSHAFSEHMLRSHQARLSNNMQRLNSRQISSPTLSISMAGSSAGDTMQTLAHLYADRKTNKLRVEFEEHLAGVKSNHSDELASLKQHLQDSHAATVLQLQDSHAATVSQHESDIERYTNEINTLQDAYTNLKDQFSLALWTLTTNELINEARALEPTHSYSVEESGFEIFKFATRQMIHEEQLKDSGSEASDSEDNESSTGSGDEDDTLTSSVVVNALDNNLVDSSSAQGFGASGSTDRHSVLPSDVQSFKSQTNLLDAAAQHLNEATESASSFVQQRQFHATSDADDQYN